MSSIEPSTSTTGAAASSAPARLSEPAPEAEARFYERAMHVLAQLRELLQAMDAAEAEAHEALSRVAESARPGAANLVHYLAFRRFDVRPLQAQLSELGLSSLGRSEGRIYDAVHGVIALLGRVLGQDASVRPVRVDDPRARLAAHSRALLGPIATTAIMVTLPSEAARDGALVHGLLAAGMDVARINCAHDDEPAWRAMVAHVTRASEQLGRSCRILFDLPGPKLRTLAIAEGPRVLRLSPERDALGAQVRPARLFLRAVEGALEGFPAAGEIPLPASFVRKLEVGDRVTFKDARGKRRKLRVVFCTEEGVQTELSRSAYVTEATAFRRKEHGDKVRPLALRPRAQALALATGDTLVLSARPELGTPAVRDGAGRITRPARIGCALPELVAALRVGEAVHFDDGKIAAQVAEVGPDEALLCITDAGLGCAKLRSEKGINIPELALDLPSLGKDDLAALDVATELADLVGLSFARSARDVRGLYDALEARGANNLGVVLKIETKRGFSELPAMLLAGLGRLPLGVMIARGDLAVECGFERLAELQEEILWLCEAAHVPAIWATEVLERLAKKGRATRAEITDAAMAERAECVMLNKGPHIVRTVETLRDILGRMHGHQQKKTSLLRPLKTPRFTASS